LSASARKIDRNNKMAPRGAIFRWASFVGVSKCENKSEKSPVLTGSEQGFDAVKNLVTMPLDDHGPVVVTMTPSAMIAAVAMATPFGARAVATMMIAVITATLDHDGLGACDRRRRDDERTKCGDNKSKLLHSSPPQLIEDRTSQRGERSNGTRRDF
jgi:hypothetical protein